MMIMEDRLWNEGKLPVTYQNILHEYDIYHENGGNSYITEKVESYKTWFKERFKRKITTSAPFWGAFKKGSKMSQSLISNLKAMVGNESTLLGRQDTIHGIVHHAASTSLDSVGQVFSQYGRGGSAHYGVKVTQVHQYVRRRYSLALRRLGRQLLHGWHRNSKQTGAPNWLVDDETLNLLQLVADIAKAQRTWQNQV